MRDFELKLAQPTEFKWSPWKRATTEAWDGIICDSALRKFVELPKNCHAITLVFSEKRKTDSFKLVRNCDHDSHCNPFIVSGTGKLALYHGADQLIRQQLRVGRAYVRVEYV